MSQPSRPQARRPRPLLFRIVAGVVILALLGVGTTVVGNVDGSRGPAAGLIGFIVLAKTYRSFPLTTLVYNLILLHSIILMVGGHYTYAEVPLFDWFKEWFGATRNNYDKLGHLAQGFVPLLIARELVIRKQIIRGRAWQHFFCVCFCLAFSAWYELLEWAVALVSGESAEAFLGTQGYIWDT